MNTRHIESDNIDAYKYGPLPLSTSVADGLYTFDRYRYYQNEIAISIIDIDCRDLVLVVSIAIESRAICPTWSNQLAYAILQLNHCMYRYGNVCIVITINLSKKKLVHLS